MKVDSFHTVQYVCSSQQNRTASSITGFHIAVPAIDFGKQRVINPSRTGERIACTSALSILPLLGCVGFGYLQRSPKGGASQYKGSL
jgi:hypothetical protein